MRELEADLRVPKPTVPEISMQDLGVKHVIAKLVLWLLLLEQKEHRAAVANDFIQTATNESDFLKKVITRDELCVYSCDPEMKAQSSQGKFPGSACLKKAQQSLSKTKTMVTVFFDWDGVVHHEHAPPGQIINKEYCLSVLHWSRDAI